MFMHKYTHTHNHTHSNRCTEAPFPKPAQRLHALTVFLIYARAENCLNCLVDVFVFVYVCVRACVYVCVCVFVCCVQAVAISHKLSGFKLSAQGQTSLLPLSLTFEI